MKTQRETDLFSEISPEELEIEVPEPWWRKPLIIIIGIFLLVLIVSFTLSDVLQGIIQSRPVENNKLLFGNATVIFENSTLERLQQEFVANEHREIKACLFGRQQDSSYIVSSVGFPEVIRANVLHVVSVSCPINTLIDLHSHPINQCLASEQDVSVYNKMKESNPSVRMMVMCSQHRFAII